MRVLNPYPKMMNTLDSNSIKVTEVNRSKFIAYFVPILEFEGVKWVIIGSEEKVEAFKNM